MLILSNITFAQQKYDVYPITTQYNFSLVRDMSFVDLNNGYLAAVKLVFNGGNYTGDVNYVFKTTNSGTNWTKVWEYTYDVNSKKPTVSFINANTGYVSKRTELKKTTNGGQNWTNINTSGLSNINDNLICTRSNGDLFLLQVDASTIFKYSISTGTFQVIKNFGSGYSIKFIEISKLNDNNIYVCGYHAYGSNYRPFFAKSTDAGANWEIKIDGSEDTYGSGFLEHMSVTSDGFNDVVKLGGISKLIEFKNNQVNILNNYWGTGRRISYGDANNGYYLSYDGVTDDPPQPTGLANAYKTTDGGQTWVNDLEINSAGHSLNSSYRFFSKGNIVYLTESVDGATGYFRVRNLNENILTYYNNISNSGSFKINNVSNNTPDTKYIRGGSYPLWTEPILNQGQTEEKIFYKWSFNSMLNSISSYDLFYEGALSTHYKTKQKSTDETAIANANQTKAIRGVNGSTFQIHSSIGGIFYTVSTSQNSDFGSEIVVNTNDDYAQLPNSNTADNNKNPSINVIKYFETDNSSLPAAYTMASAWERFDQNTNKTDILCALSMGTSTSPWIRFGNNLSALDGKITTLNNTSLSFNSKPDVYSMHISGATDDVRNYLMIVPHLEPSENNYKLVTSVRYQNVDCFDYEALRLEDPEFETNDYKIVSDNITDFSVTYKPVTYNSQKAVYLYFTYKKNGNIYYKRDLIYFFSNGNSSQVIREEIPEAERDFEVSNGDNQSLRNTPDITLRNGMPTISYQGKYDVNREVYYEGNISGPTVPLHYYPIFVKMRDVNGDWLSYCYNSNGFQTQENPDIEGSTDYDAFVVNYSKACSTFYQFVKIIGLPGYICSPGYFTGKDAKFVKGSYSGQVGTSTYPSLITLSNLSNSVHTVAMQPFTINNNQTSDGFSNLDGSIEIDNTTYSLTLGPIIASNTTYGFEDDTPPQTVQTPVEFNESMVSNEFPLSNNDTLILGAHGKYTSVGLQLQPLKYHVNLVNATTNQIHRELFRDTINIEDSVGIEFLRGFVINSIDKGTDQFYVQMIVDTVDAEDGDYMMAGVYSDNTPPEGDASHIYKTKVFFENGTTPALNNISNQIPKEFALSQNYPNPFNPSTTIKYSLPKDGLVTMKIYDMAGREVAKLVNEVKKAGYYQVQFNASNLASGVYFYRIQSNDFVMTKRMVLIK